MPEIVRVLTDDHDRITHLLTMEEEPLSVEDLADRLDRGEDFYVTFGEETHYSITILAEDGHLVPSIDDPSGEHSIWDLPTEEDPAEEEIEEMYEELERMGEFEVDPGSGENEEDDDELRKFQ